MTRRYLLLEIVGMRGAKLDEGVPVVWRPYCWTLMSRPIGLAVAVRHAGEHDVCLYCGDRQRPGREHAYREQLTLIGLRDGGEG